MMAWGILVPLLGIGGGADHLFPIPFQTDILTNSDLEPCGSLDQGS
jgi:hypothetical protein